MKARDSGMPEDDMWAMFFDTDRILTQLGCDDPAVVVGCEGVNARGSQSKSGKPAA